jgi:hypothetical protein
MASILALLNAVSSSKPLKAGVGKADIDFTIEVGREGAIEADGEGATKAGASVAGFETVMGFGAGVGAGAAITTGAAVLTAANFGDGADFGGGVTGAAAMGAGGATVVLTIFALAGVLAGAASLTFTGAKAALASTGVFAGGAAALIGVFGMNDFSASG